MQIHWLANFRKVVTFNCSSSFWFINLTRFGLKCDWITKFQFTATFQFMCCTRSCMTEKSKLPNPDSAFRSIVKCGSPKFISGPHLRWSWCFRSNMGTWRWHFKNVPEYFDAPQVWNSLLKWRHYRENNRWLNERGGRGGFILCLGVTVVGSSLLS